MTDPVPPSGIEPPAPESSSQTADEYLVSVLIVLAVLAIWRFGWWGIAISLAGFLVITFISAINKESAHLERRPRRRHPPLAQVHAAATEFVGGIVGFGLAAAIGLGVSDGLAGVLAVATAATLISEAFSRLLRLDWTGALGSWTLVVFASVAVTVPLAAWIAPGYRVDGFIANAVTIVLVYASEWLVWRASPWRNAWAST